MHGQHDEVKVLTATSFKNYDHQCVQNVKADLKKQGNGALKRTINVVVYELMSAVKCEQGKLLSCTELYCMFQNMYEEKRFCTALR